MEPKEIVQRIESSGSLPAGKDDRFVGYGVMGVTFTSGHALAMRRFPVNSLGSPYTSVWHLNPHGEWTFIQDVPPHRGCSRYFGSAVSKSIQQEIEIVWTGPRDFVLSVEGDYPVYWQVSLDQTLATEIMNNLGSHLPDSVWHNEAVLGWIGKAGSKILGAGQLKLTGRVPNGQKFIANPKYVWMIAASSATVCGENLGQVGPLSQQAKLGDVWIPQQGRFFIGSAYLEAFDPARHLSVLSKERRLESQSEAA